MNPDKGRSNLKLSAKAALPERHHQPSQSEAISLLRAGRLSEATAMLHQIASSEPDNWQCLHLLGLAAYRQGMRAEAISHLLRCLDVKPDLAEAYSDLGVILTELGQLDEAREACGKAIALKPGFHPAYSNLGNISKAQRRLDEAVRFYRKAIELAPDFADAHANLGMVLVALGKTEEGLAFCRKAANLAPTVAEMQAALGHALRHNGKLEEALASYRTAIAIKPAFASAYTDLGCLLHERGELEAALHAHRQALTVQPDHADAHNNLGVTLKHLGRYRDAEEHCRKAVELKPDSADAWCNLGVVLYFLGEREEAVAAYRRSISLNPLSVVSLVNIAAALWDLGELAEAAVFYEKALAVEPGQPTALVDSYNLRRYLCDWDELPVIEERILRKTYRAGHSVPSFPLLSIVCSPEEHLLAAREWAGHLPVTADPFEHAPLRSASGDGRLRIGYLSSDFCSHATSGLIAELLERHDRSRFEIFGYCFSRDDGSALRRRVIAAFDQFVPVHELSHRDTARRIHADGIDILIDLKGYTAGPRTEILKNRPAPIQVNYLGYPATMGADFIDYIVADPFILPMDQAAFYDEKIVHLPHCYQPNDTKRIITSETPSRADYGLPDKGFVFCCFNNTYKISPERFAAWMRLLAAVPGSVLWLLETNRWAAANLRREAEAQGIDPERLVFTPKIDLAKHLARHRLADLFLDTGPVNAHTTASDALWSGLPVLTLAGGSFVSRVCGSLLHAVGLPELVTQTLEGYEAMALRLARDPAVLAGLRERLARNRLSSPLFDIGQYTRDLEAAYEHMAGLHASGERPRAFAVAETREQAPVAGLKASSSSARAATPCLPSPATATAPQTVDARIAYDACPLCDGTRFVPHREGGCGHHPCYDPALPRTMSWHRCDDCDHVFTNGYFTPEAAQAILAKTQPYQSVGHDAEKQRVVSARIVEHVVRYAAAQGSDGCGDWLDIGFGNGSLIFTAAEWGFTPVGLDVRRENVQDLAKLGYEAHGTPVEELDFPGRFAVVSMADVLEHMPFPKAALAAVHGLLRAQGVLFLSMPNMDSIVWRLLDTSSSNPYWGELEHYHNFSRARLYGLLDEHGFAPVHYYISERYRACMEVVAVKR